MIIVNLDKLNPLEKEINQKLMVLSKELKTIKITDAARHCNVSISKISKMSKKLGFVNYKQYVEFLYGRFVPDNRYSDELKKLQRFIENFDISNANELKKLINDHEKIILFGYGPSLEAANYIEYRLRTIMNKVTTAVGDEISISTMADEKTLLIILTATGQFHSFEDVYNSAHKRGSKVIIVAEEFNTNLLNQCDKIFWLTRTSQESLLEPYEKSRTLLFIFFEEIFQSFIRGDEYQK